MKFLVVAVFVALACGIEAGGIRGRSRRASATGDQEASVLRSESAVQPDGFSYTYETGNGIFAESTGKLEKVDKDEAITVQGRYKYTSPDGTPIDLSYVADVNGYHPVGDHIPVPPAIPEAILRSLEYIKNHPAPVSEYKKP